MIKWKNLEILCENYEIVGDYVYFEFANNELIVPLEDIKEQL